MISCKNESAINKYSSKQVVDGILAFIDTKVFNGKDETIHNVIYKLKRIPKYEEFFKNLEFNTWMRYPYSEELGEIFFGLKHSRVVNVDNPEYRKFTLKDRIKKELRSKTAVRFNKEEIGKIKEMALIFEEDTKIDGE